MFCQKYSSKYMYINNNNKKLVLRDILHTPDLDFSKYYKITDIPINIFLFLLIFRYNKNLHKFLFIMAINYIIRAISFSITILPKCGVTKDKDNTRSCTSMLLDYVTLKDTHIGHNQDLLFSGHASFSLLFSLYISYIEKVKGKTKNVIWLITLLNSIGIIITRCHYSIDVYYAYIVTLSTFFLLKNKINHLLKY